MHSSSFFPTVLDVPLAGFHTTLAGLSRDFRHGPTTVFLTVFHGPSSRVKHRGDEPTSDPSVRIGRSKVYWAATSWRPPWWICCIFFCGWNQSAKSRYPCVRAHEPHIFVGSRNQSTNPRFLMLHVISGFCWTIICCRVWIPFQLGIIIGEHKDPNGPISLCHN